MNRSDVTTLLKNYKDLNATRYGITALGFFGSMARDQSRPDSDLDICIKTNAPDPYILAHVKQEIEQIAQIRVDIVRLRDSMNAFLKNRIEKECIYV